MNWTDVLGEEKQQAYYLKIGLGGLSAALILVFVVYQRKQVQNKQSKQR